MFDLHCCVCAGQVSHVTDIPAFCACVSMSSEVMIVAFSRKSLNPTAKYRTALLFASPKTLSEKPRLVVDAVEEGSQRSRMCYELLAVVIDSGHQALDVCTPAKESHKHALVT